MKVSDMKKVDMVIFFFLFFLSGYGQNKVHSGFDVGYSHEGFVPITLYAGLGSTQYGLTVGVPTKTGTNGAYHPVINWTDFPEDADVVSEGEYYLPLMLNLSRPVHDNIYLGGGVGYAFKTSYRNLYDNSGTLGDYGHYHIKAPDKGKIDYIMFISYVLPSLDSSHHNIKLFYSGLMGFGASFGFAF